MPKSKPHAKRRAKQKDRQEKAEKWVAKKVDAFNALPEEAKSSMLKRWSFGKKKQEPSHGHTHDHSPISYVDGQAPRSVEGEDRRGWPDVSSPIVGVVGPDAEPE